MFRKYPQQTDMLFRPVDHLLAKRVGIVDSEGDQRSTFKEGSTQKACAVQAQKIGHLTSKVQEEGTLQKTS